MSVALQIRDVPEDIRDALADLARQRGQSLQAFLLALVAREARFARNLALLRQFEGRDDGVSDVPQVTEMLDAVRAERDTRNMGPDGQDDLD
jgi:antitoxin FitA